MILLDNNSQLGSMPVSIELSDRHGVVSSDESKKIYDTLSAFAEKLARQTRLHLVEATVDAYRNKNGKFTNYNFHLRIHPVRGKGFMTEVEDKKLMNAVHIAIDKVKHQASHIH